MRICDFKSEDVGVSYTLMLIEHTKRNYDSFRRNAISMNKNLYGLNQEKAEELVSVLIIAFKEHNLAEHENTPENDRKQHWKNAKKALVSYFTTLAKAFKGYGIDINPKELAANEIDWWQNHNIKDYDKTAKGLKTKYELLYKLSPSAAWIVALKEIEATELYDHAKKEDNNQLWIETKISIITCYSVLQKELMKKYPGD